MFMPLIFDICSNFQLEIMLLHTCEQFLEKGGGLGSNVDLTVSLVFHLQFTSFHPYIYNLQIFFKEGDIMYKTRVECASKWKLNNWTGSC